MVLETLSKYIQSRKVTGIIQHGTMEGKQCLTSPRAFCDQVTSMVDEGRAVAVIHVDFRQAFHTVSLKTLVGVALRHGFMVFHWYSTS